MKGYFRKRGDFWSFTVDIGRDPITNERKQKTKGGFKTKKEAEKSCAEIIAQVENYTYAEPSKMPLGEFLKQWLEGKERTLRKVTFDTYTRHCTLHIIPRLGKLELIQLTPLHINKFHIYLEKEKGLSERSILDVHSVLKNALEQAVKWSMIPKNPASLIDRPKVSKQEIQVWDLDTVTTFLETARKDRTYIAFLLALTTGMRQGEVLGLRWKDVLFDNHTVSVRQTLQHDGKEFQSDTKTQAGTRSISIDETTAAELQKHRKVIATERIRIGPAYKDHDLVVPTTLGTPYSPRNLLRTFYRLIKDAGVPHISFHDLRHTHATLLLAQGVHPKIVAERLGHTDVRITMNTYSHLLPNMQKETAVTFGKMFYKTSES